MSNIKYNKLLSKYYPDRNLFIKNKFEIKNKFIQNSNYLYQLDLNALFLKERDESTIYRIISSLSLLASNMLINTTGEQSYETINSIIYDNEGELVYSFDEIVKENDGWFSYITNLETCNKLDLEPTRDRFFINNYNWNIFLSYEYDKDNSLSFFNVPLSNGIAITSVVQKTISESIYSVIKSAFNINNFLKVGDIICINTDEEHYVQIIDLINDYEFLIDSQINYITGSYFYKYVEGIKSQYFLTLLKKIDIPLKVLKNGFSTNIYNDNINLLLIDDLNTKDIFSYDNKPLNKIYLTTIKNSNSFFNTIKSGLNLNDNINQYNSKKIDHYNNLFLENGIDENSFYGNIVEYTPKLDSYITIDSINHIFNTINRDNNQENEHYIYCPIYEIILKKVSNNIISNPDGFYDGSKYYYREVLSNSQSNIYPFLNGANYIENKLILPIYRQNPCNNSDVINGICDNLNITIENQENNLIC